MASLSPTELQDQLQYILTSKPASPRTLSVSGDDPKPTARHTRYYFQDSLVVFSVEGELWKVHRHHFVRESPVFQSMLLFPQGEEGPQGESDQEPIPLPDVTRAEMEILLDYFYEGPKFEQYLLSLATRSATASKGSEPTENEIKMEEIKYLLNLFSIANRYDFAQVRQYVIRTIEKIRVEVGSGLDDLWTPVDRIVIADKFDVTEWLVPASEELCQRPGYLTVAEVERIGPRRTAIIASAREQLRYPAAEGGEVASAAEGAEGAPAEAESASATECGPGEGEQHAGGDATTIESGPAEGTDSAPTTEGQPEAQTGGDEAPQADTEASQTEHPPATEEEQPPVEAAKEETPNEPTEEAPILEQPEQAPVETEGKPVEREGEATETQGEPATAEE